MDSLLLDIRYGIRQLFRQRGSSIVAILTLAIGMAFLLLGACSETRPC